MEATTDYFEMYHVMLLEKCRRRSWESLENRTSGKSKSDEDGDENLKWLVRKDFHAKK